MTLQTHGRVVDLHELPSEHITIDIFSFASGKFVVPEEAGTSEEFELATPSCFATAMPAQSCEAKFDVKSDTCPPTTHVGAVGQGKEIGGRSANTGCNSHGSSSKGAQPEGAFEKLAGGLGQDRRDPGARSGARRYGGLVLGVGLTTIGPVLCRTIMPRRFNELANYLP